MKVIATKQGYLGRLREPGEVFDAPEDLKASWFEPEKAPAGGKTEKAPAGGKTEKAPAGGKTERDKPQQETEPLV